MITLKCFHAHIMLIFRQWRSPHLLLDVHKAEEEGTDGKRMLEGAEFCIHGSAHESLTCFHSYSVMHSLTFPRRRIFTCM